MNRQRLMTMLRATTLMLFVLGLVGMGQVGLTAQHEGIDDLRINASAQNDEDTLTIRARRGDDIETMDPAFHDGNEEYNLNMAIFSRLMRFKPGSSELELDAAKSVDVSDDSKTVTFELKEGIQFHRGFGELTAEDVKFSYERIAGPELDSPYSGDWATLDRVEVTGRYSGKLHFTEPLASLFTSTFPFSSGAIVSKEAMEELGDEFATNPVGSGPYQWSDWEPGQRIVIERFDDYYGEAPDFRRIEIRTIEEPSSAEVAFERGEIDETSISVNSIDRFEAMDDVEIHRNTNLRYQFLGFNVQKEPFDDVRVRRAVRLAVNVEEVLDGAFNGVPSRNDCMIPEGILGHWEDCPTYEQDLERARELLAEAGYPDGFETQIITTQPQVHIDASQIIQQQLRQVGIDAEIDLRESGFDVLSEGPPGMHFYSFSLTFDPDYWMIWFTCDQVGKWNFSQWCNEEFDALQQEGVTTTDRDEREEIYIEMQQIMDEDVPVVWITNGVDLHVSRPSVVEPSFVAMYSQYQFFEKVDGGE